MTTTEAQEIVAAIKPNYCPTKRQQTAQQVVAEAKAKDEAEAKAEAERRAKAGKGLGSVRRQTSLRRNYSLVWSGVGNLPDSAEIWDAQSRVIYRGTLAQCEERADRDGLSW